jgi:hypothetical protein
MNIHALYRTAQKVNEGDLSDKISNSETERVEDIGLSCYSGHVALEVKRNEGSVFKRPIRYYEAFRIIAAEYFGEHE